MVTNNNIINDLVVVKRSGQRVNFYAPKIALAIKNAFDSVEGNYNENNINKIYLSVLEYIVTNYKDRKTINVEDIQNIIEEQLQKHKYLDVYTSFNDYRNKRAESRRAFPQKQEHKLVKTVEKISSYILQKDSNNFSFNEIITNFGETISTEVAKIYLLDNKYTKAHEEGNIFIHDLSYLTTGMLPALHLKINKETFDENLYRLIRSLKKARREIYGEICLDSIDQTLSFWLIANYKIILKNNILKYLRVQGLLNYINEKELENIICNLQTIEININVFKSLILNRVIENIFDIAISDSKKELDNILKKELEMLISELVSSGYKYSFSLGTCTSIEGKLITEYILKIINRLDYLNNVSLIYKIKEGLNHNLLEKVVQLVNNNKNIAFTFMDASYNKDNSEDVEYFANGCRIFENIVSPKKKSTGRMVIATTSINLARLGIKNKDRSRHEFNEELSYVLKLVKNELLLVFENISNKGKENYKYLLDNNIVDNGNSVDNQKVRKIMKNGILNISLTGLKECALCLGKEDNYLEVCREIVSCINRICKEFVNETKLNFVISMTDNEKIAAEFLRLDKIIYGNIEGFTDRKNYSVCDKVIYDENLDDQLKPLKGIFKLLNGGAALDVKMPRRMKDSEIIDLLNNLKVYDVGFLRLRR